MAQYLYEGNIITVGDLLMEVDGIAKHFTVGKYEFVKSVNQPQFGCRYILRFKLEAYSWVDLNIQIGKEIYRLVDSLAFYYSTPFIWEWWLYAFKKENGTANRILVTDMLLLPEFASPSTYTGQDSERRAGIPRASFIHQKPTPQ